MSFCVCLILFSIWLSRSIHVVTCLRISFLFILIYIPLYEYTLFYLSIHLLMGTKAVSTFWLLWIMPLWTLVYKCLFECVISIFLSIYPDVELLDHMVIWGIVTLFPRWLHNFTFLSAVHTGSSISTSFPYFSFHPSLIFFLLGLFYFVFW